MLQTQTGEHAEGADDSEAAAVDTTLPGLPTELGTGRELFFQRCLWCGTPDYRRSFCRVCGAMAFSRERSAGVGVVVRRSGHAQQNTWFVAMDEGFNLLCQVTGTAPVVVALGARVTVVRAVAPLGQGLPFVELTQSAQPLKPCW